MPEYSYATNGLDISRLRRTMESDRKRLEPFRQQRKMFIEQFVGKWYGKNEREKVPFNFIELVVNIYLRQLAARNPRAMVSSRSPDLRASSETLEGAINWKIQSIQLVDTLRLIFQEALFGLGIGLVGPNQVIGEDSEGRELREVVMDCVSLDHFGMDMCVEDHRRATHMEHRYRVPIDEAKSDKSFKKSVRDKLKPVYKTGYDDGGLRRTHELGSGSYNYGDDEFESMVELWDVWLPRQRLVVTMPAECGVDEALREAEWEGPDRGPYHLLKFTDVPSNVMPLSMCSTIFDIHELLNDLLLKAGRQAINQKTIIGVGSGAQQDGERIQGANDLDIIKVDNPDKINPMRLNGPDAPTLAMFMQMQRTADYAAGNVSAVGGLGPQSETATQDQMLIASAIKRVSDMQDRAIAFTKRVVHDLAWYMWHDPLLNISVVKRAPGLEDPVVDRLTAANRRGDFFDYEFEVDPYSMEHQTPQTKLKSLMEVWQGIIAPFSEQLMQQGAVINWENLLRLTAKYSNMKDLEEIVSFNAPSMPQIGMEQQTPQRSGRFPVTNRISTRVNRPGTTRQGADEAMMSLLKMGPNQQPREAAAGARMVG